MLRLNYHTGMGDSVHSLLRLMNHIYLLKSAATVRTTLAEDQIIQQVQQHEQVIQETEQLTIKMDKKLRKLKKQQKQEPEIQPLYKKAFDDVTTSITNESFEHLTTPTYEALPVQTLPQDIIESTALAEVPLMGPSVKPQSARAVKQLTPQKNSIFEEVSLVLETEQRTEKFIPTKEKVSESVTNIKMTVPQTNEVQPEQMAGKVVPLQVTSAIASSIKDMKQLQSVVVAIPLIGESASENIPELSKADHHAKFNITPLQAQQQEEVMISDTIEPLSVPRTPKITPTIQPEFSQNKALEILETVSLEREKKADITKPENIKLVGDRTPMLSKIEISETLSHDSVRELLLIEQPTSEYIKTEFREHEFYTAAQPLAIEKEGDLMHAPKPSTVNATCSLMESGLPLEITESKIAETVTETPSPRPTLTALAIDRLVLQDSILMQQPDAQSPLEEQQLPYLEQAKQAKIEMSGHLHVTGREEFVNEIKPQDFTISKTTAALAKVSSESAPLLANEVNATTSSESLGEMVNPETESTHIIKQSLIPSRYLAATQQDQAFESAKEGKLSAPELQRGRQKLNDRGHVANITEIFLQDKEMELKTVTPARDNAKATVEETANVLSVSTQQAVESESELQTLTQPSPHTADRKPVIADMRAAQVEIMSTQNSTTCLEETQIHVGKAQPEVFAISAGLITAPVIMESHDEIPAQKNVETAQIKSEFSLNKSSIEIYEVNVSEGSAEHIKEKQPNTVLVTPKPSEEVLKSYETTEIIPYEHSKEQEKFAAPNAVKLNFNMTTQHATQTTIQTKLDFTGKLTIETQPEGHHTQFETDLIEPLTNTFVQTHDKETDLPTQDKPVAKKAIPSTTNPLGVAQTTSNEVADYVDEFNPFELNRQQATYSVDHAITPAVYSEIQSLEPIGTYETKLTDVPKLTNMTIVENKMTLQIETTFTSENENESKTELLPSVAKAEEKLDVGAHKSPLTNIQEICDSLKELENDSSLETHCKVSGSGNLNEILVRGIQIYETEKQLTPAAHHKKQMANLEVESGVAALEEKTNVLESIEDFLSPPLSTSTAQITKVDTNLKVPVHANVETDYCMGKLQDFHTKNAQAMTKSDVLSETITTETLIYEDIKAKEVQRPLTKEKPTESIVEVRQYTIIEETPILLNREQELPEAVASNKVAQFTLSDKHPVPTTYKSIIMENVDILENFDLDSQNIKQITDDRLMFVGTSDQPQLLDSSKMVQGSDIAQPVQANVEHELAHSVTLEIQQLAELEGMLSIPRKTFSEISQITTSQMHGAPTIEEVKPQESASQIETLPLTGIIAKPIIEGTSHEISTTQVQPLEKLTKLDANETQKSRAVVTLNDSFKEVHLQCLTETLQSEADLSAFLPSEHMAKPCIAGMLTETQILKVTPYEKLIEAPSKLRAEAIAKCKAEDVLQRTQLKEVNVVMQSESLLSELSPRAQRAKAYMEGSQLETTVSEITALELLDDIKKSSTNEEFVQPSLSEVVGKAQLINKPLVLEKEAEIPTKISACSHSAFSTNESAHIEKTVTQVTACEDVSTLKEYLPFTSQIANVLIAPNEGEVQIVSTETTFGKEDILPEESEIKQEKAILTHHDLRAAIIEENLSLTTISETYEMTPRPERHATITQEMPSNKAKTIQATLAYEESTNLEPVCFDRFSHAESKTDARDALRTTTVQTFENIGEESGDFKPNETTTKPSISKSDMKASVTEEISPHTCVKLLEFSPTTTQSASVMRHGYHEKLLVSSVTPFENANELDSIDFNQQRASSMIEANSKAVATTSEQQPTSSTKRIEDLKPIEKLAHAEVTPTSTYIQEHQVVPVENVIDLQQHPVLPYADANKLFHSHNAYSAQSTETFEHVTPFSDKSIDDMSLTQSNKTDITTCELTTAVQSTQLIADTISDFSTITSKPKLSNAYLHIQSNNPKHECETQLILETETILPKLCKTPTLTPTVTETPQQYIPVKQQDIPIQTATELLTEWHKYQKAHTNLIELSQTLITDMTPIYTSTKDLDLMPPEKHHIKQATHALEILDKAHSHTVIYEIDTTQTPHIPEHTIQDTPNLMLQPSEETQLTEHAKEIPGQITIIKTLPKNQGRQKQSKRCTSVVRTAEGDKEDVTKIETVEEDDKKLQTTVMGEQIPIDEQPEEVKELPEEVRVVETISKDGKPTKKKIRTRVIKKIKGGKQEVTKIETVEEDDKKPQTTVTVEEAPIDEQPEEVKELPEEVRVVETISKDGKPTKKKIRTRVIKKIKGDKQEVTKIETVEEDDKKPQTT
uniref:Uncharacterized protein n=1 Tax=Glossina austeni TaxID=7395 RepID=A0A1A9VJ41_GLOAU